ncbi:ABC-2 type transport system ATP-binding protein [Wenyingzhuangia heitensis]|uniref:ABC-2 type transport system ATP-binding protein n=1 Tax=Wenyingzhuangia heitensis TaxID=1487859 RepID=A0ABX0UC89_9FLAO|nr:ATP-binding cassette domain-containing protein [Wenyingzhuangia heitensis]NIJ46444.1 ABC-2 type transport system ATP-binding protein [Wenyingzhuangia heitensis]
MQEIILDIQNLHKSYGSKMALKGVSLQINKGTIYGLIGQNGAGKTTLIRILNQIIEADRGNVFFNGKPLTARDIKTLGYLPEERGLYKNMTIEEQALYFGQLKGMTKMEAKNQLNYWLDRFDITTWKNKKIQDLSKGMAQKVQFIITVLNQPNLLILDEPFSGFDPLNAQLIADEIKNLAQQGTTVIFSSHRMESVADMCDALSLIHNGEIILQGSISEIQKKYAKEIYEIHLVNTHKEQLATFLNNNAYSTLIVEDNKQELKLEVTKVTTERNLLQDILKLGELKLYKQYIPSLQEIFIKTIENA